MKWQLPFARAMHVISGWTGMFEHLGSGVAYCEENDFVGTRKKKSMLSNGHGSKKILSFTISQLKKYWLSY